MGVGVDEPEAALRGVPPGENVACMLVLGKSSDEEGIAPANKEENRLCQPHQRYKQRYKQGKGHEQCAFMARRVMQRLTC